MLFRSVQYDPHAGVAGAAALRDLLQSPASALFSSPRGARVFVDRQKSKAARWLADPIVIVFEKPPSDPTEGSTTTLLRNTQQDNNNNNNTNNNDNNNTATRDGTVERRKTRKVNARGSPRGSPRTRRATDTDVTATPPSKKKGLSSSQRRAIAAAAALDGDDDNDGDAATKNGDTQPRKGRVRHRSRRKSVDNVLDPVDIQVHSGSTTISQTGDPSVTDENTDSSLPSSTGARDSVLDAAQWCCEIGRASCRERV